MHHGARQPVVVSQTDLRHVLWQPGQPQDQAAPGEVESEAKVDANPADAQEAVKAEQAVKTDSKATSVARMRSLEDLKAAGPFKRPFLLEVKGAIDGTTLKFVRSGVLQAQVAKADLLVVQIDSPGGGAVESMEIADLLAQVNWAKTVALIPREATSGGALIALGCEYIVLQPGATIGDIGVIQLDPTMMAFRYAPAKIRSILVAKARALCELHGRSPDLAEAMIDEYAVIYRQKDAPNQFKLVSMGTPDGDPQADKPRRPVRPPANANEQAQGQAVNGVVAREELEGGWQLIAETRPGRFLAVPDRRAAELGISQGSVLDRKDLEEQISVTGDWQKRTYGFTDSVVDFLNNFWITGLILAVGIIALFIEISAPGISVGGLVALLCFSLFFWSHFAGGTAGWLEVLLFLLGVVFLLAELFVIPGFGVAGIMGVSLVGASLIMACLDFLYPTNDSQWQDLGWTVLTVSASGVFGLLGVLAVINYIGSIPALNRLALAPPEMADLKSQDKKNGGQNGESNVATFGRAAGLKVGDEGRTESVLRPAGRARIEGRSIDVVADGKFIEVDLPVKILEIRGNRITVVQMGASDSKQGQVAPEVDV